MQTALSASPRLVDSFSLSSVVVMLNPFSPSRVHLRKGRVELLGHMTRVKWLVVQMAMALSWTRGNIECLELAGLLHDIGKSWDKESEELFYDFVGPFSPEQRAQAAKHPKRGAEMLLANPSAYGVRQEQATLVAAMIAGHHDPYDDCGNKLQVKTRELGLRDQGDLAFYGSLLITVADYFDASTAERPNDGKERRTRTSEGTLDEMRPWVNKKFCPAAFWALEVQVEHAMMALAS